MEQENKNIKTKESTSIPYFVHEGTIARFERINKRLWITVILLILLLVGTNGAWIWYESQWEVVESTEVSQSVVQEADSDGDNTFIGGDYYGKTEDKTND